MDGVKPDGVLGPKSTDSWFMSTAFDAMAKHAQQTGRGRTGIGDERVRLVRAQARKIERENAVAAGEYTDTEVAGGWFSESLRRIRGGMLAVPSRAWARLPHMTRFDFKVLEEEVAAAINDAADAEEHFFDAHKAERARAQGPLISNDKPEKNDDAAKQ